MDCRKTSSNIIKVIQPTIQYKQRNETAPSVAI